MLIKRLLLVRWFVVCFALAWIVLAAQQQSVGIERRPELPVTEVQQVVRAHHCWTNHAEMPADMEGQFPGGTVVTLPDSVRPVYTRNPVWLHRALDDVLPPYHEWPGLQVHAFCR